MKRVDRLGTNSPVRAPGELGLVQLAPEAHDVDATFAADHIHLLALFVEEQVIGVTAGFRAADPASRLRVIDQQPRRQPGHDEEPVAR
jgi:hypothetical protein